MFLLPVISSFLFFLALFLAIRYSSGPLLNRFNMFAERDAKKFEDWADRLFIDWSPDKALKMSRLFWTSILTSIVFGLLVFLFTGISLPLLLVPIIIYFFPRKYYERLHERRLNKIEDQLPQAINIMVTAVRAGRSLAQAVGDVAKKGPVPVREEFAVIAKENVSGGLNLQAAFENARRRVESESFRMICTALIINLSQGGDVLNILERISDSILELSRLRKKILSETADIRSQEKMAIYMTPLFFLLVCAYDSSILFTLGATWSGNILVAVVFIMQMGSYLWIRRIVRTAI